MNLYDDGIKITPNEALEALESLRKDGKSLPPTFPAGNMWLNLDFGHWETARPVLERFADGFVDWPAEEDVLYWALGQWNDGRLSGTLGGVGTAVALVTALNRFAGEWRKRVGR